jgi:hypothetical protein
VSISVNASSANFFLRGIVQMVRLLPIAIPFVCYFAGLPTAGRRKFGLKASLRRRGLVIAESGVFN